MANITTEFFRTLKEAEEFKPICNLKNVFGKDKPGTVEAFKFWLYDAISYGREKEVKNARAVVVMYR